MIGIIKNNIKREIKARGLTTEKVCKALGKDRRYIYRTTDKIKVCKLLDIANAIGCDVSELLKGLN